MATRSIGLVACLVTLLAPSAGAALASSASRGVAAGPSTPVAFCPADSSSPQGRAISTSTRTRIAFKCRCCGRDENGHCNHQRCD